MNDDYYNKVLERNSAVDENGNFLHPTLADPEYHLVKHREKVPIECLIGNTFDLIKNGRNKILFFKEEDVLEFALMHVQECCEEVDVMGVEGCMQNIERVPITKASAYFDNTRMRTVQESRTRGTYIIGSGDSEIVVKSYGYSNGKWSEVLELYRILKG